MSVQTYECKAVLNVAGVESDLPLTVKYIILPFFPETRESPAEPRQIEILSIWRGDRVLGDRVLAVDMLSQAQMSAINDEILGNG